MFCQVIICLVQCAVIKINHQLVLMIFPFDEQHHLFNFTSHNLQLPKFFHTSTPLKFMDGWKNQSLSFSGDPLVGNFSGAVNSSLESQGGTCASVFCPQIGCGSFWRRRAKLVVFKGILRREKKTHTHAGIFHGGKNDNLYIYIIYFIYSHDFYTYS